MKSTLIPSRVLLALVGTLTLASVSRAQTPYGDDITQTVVRVAYLSGQVSYSRGDSPDDWQPASRNFPMTLGDRLYTARGSRLELQTEGGAIYLAPGSDLAALNLTYDVKQFSLGMGSASFHIRHIGSGESFEVDTPNAAVTFDGAGDYRVDVDRDGNTRVIVRRGHAYVASGGGEMPLEAGRLMAIDGLDSPLYDIMSLPRPDSWDRWVETRSRRYVDNRSVRYVNPYISGVEDLDQYGRWSQVPGYGTCWSPTNVSSDWQPYRVGRWAWQDPWGWSWVSNEPWGWAPYHYGRWVTSRSRWYWVPVGPDVRTVRYSPALVAFVGGPGFSASVSFGGGGNVGWFPLAPRDPFVPWWGARARESTHPGVTNVTYVNRTYVTVVNQNTFISGQPIATNTIRDPRVMQEISTAPVLRGPLPIVPVASSIRVSTERSGSAPAPPAATLNRPVVTRLAPPPAPALFQEKTHFIRENRGAPVDPAQAARLAPASREIQPTRSVVAEPGRTTLKPKTPQVSGPVPVPVTREATPGQARRESPSGQVTSAPTQQLDTRKAQDAEATRVKQQQVQQQQEQEQAKAQRQQQQVQQQQEQAKAQKQQQQVQQQQEQAKAQKQQQQVQQQQEQARQQQEQAKAQQQQLQAKQQQEQARQQQEQARQQQEQAKAQQQQQQAKQQQEQARQQQEQAKAQQQQLQAKQQQEASAKAQKAAGEQKAAQSKAKAPEEKKKQDDTAKDKKDQPNQKDQN